MRCGKFTPSDCINNKVSYKNVKYNLRTNPGEFMFTYKCTEPDLLPPPEPVYDFSSAGDLHSFVLIFCLCSCCCACCCSCICNFNGCKCFNSGREFNNPCWSGLIQGFAGVSGLLLNLGAFTGHMDDLTEIGMYENKLKDLNDTFLFLMILQVVICIFDLCLICCGFVYAHLSVMWVEDVLLEIPLLIIAMYLQTFTEGALTMIFVIVGGILGLIVAVAETLKELSEDESVTRV